MHDLITCALLVPSVFGALAQRHNIFLRGTFCCPGVGQPNTSVYNAMLPSCIRFTGRTESDIAPVDAKMYQQSVRCCSVNLFLEATCLCETAHGHAGMKRVVVFAEKKRPAAVALTRKTLRALVCA